MSDLHLSDPERLLALYYAPRGVRPALRTVWCLDETLGGFVARSENPIMGQMRLTWWHDALRSLSSVRPVDPLLLAIADTPEIEAEALLPLIDGWEVLLDPLPLPDEALKQFAEQRGATLFRAVGKLLGSTGPAIDEAGRLWALVDLAFRVSDRATAERALALAPRPVGRLPRALAVLAALAREDVRRGLHMPRRQGSPSRVMRALAAGLTGA